MSSIMKLLPVGCRLPASMETVWLFHITCCRLHRKERICEPGYVSSCSLSPQKLATLELPVEWPVVPWSYRVVFLFASFCAYVRVVCLAIDLCDSFVICKVWLSITLWLYRTVYSWIALVIPILWLEGRSQKGSVAYLECFLSIQNASCLELAFVW
jgi:hypothetical protein